MSLTEKNRWYAGVSPLDVTAEDFCKLHQTGFIPSHIYERYEETGGLKWVGTTEKYSELQETKRHGNLSVEYRKTGKDLEYCKTDADGDIVRGQDGLALMMNLEEKKAAGVALKDQTIVAFADGEPIGMVCNEFGAVGVWVESRAQKQGIGTHLLATYMLENPGVRIGQMTNAGFNMTIAAHKNLCAALAETQALPGRTVAKSQESQRREPPTQSALKD